MRITIPTNVDDHLTLAKAILAQHAALGPASPLNGIKDIATFGPQTKAADAANTLAKSLAKQAETAKQNRDLALGQSGQLTPGSVRFFVTSARDVLLGLNKGNEKKLGDWGFVVDDSPGPAKPKKA